MLTQHARTTTAADCEQALRRRCSDGPFGFHLRPGDLIRFEGQPCRVIRVADCAAVIAVDRPPREFTTLFGRRVRIQPQPALVRISPQSEVPILNR